MESNNNITMVCPVAIHFRGTSRMRSVKFQKKIQELSGSYSDELLKQRKSTILSQNSRDS